MAKATKNIKTITEATTKRDLEAKELLKEYFEQLEVQKKTEARLKEIKENIEKKYSKLDFDTLLLECYKINRVVKNVPKFDTKAFKEENEKTYNKYVYNSHCEYIQLDTVKENTKVG